MDLSEYLTYFKEMQNKEIRWTSTDSEDGMLQMGYPMYDGNMLRFVREFRKSDYFIKQYKSMLKRQSIRVRMNPTTIQQTEKIDQVLTYEAMLTLIVTAEEVDGGSWAKALQQGYLYRITSGLLAALSHEG